MTPEDDDKQWEEWEGLYAGIKGVLEKWGIEDHFGKADYLVVDDNYGTHRQKIEIHNLKMLDPAIVIALRRLLSRYPAWEIVIVVDIPGEESWPPRFDDAQTRDRRRLATRVSSEGVPGPAIFRQQAGNGVRLTACVRGCSMSMELHVLSDCQLRSIAEWQRALDDERYPLQLAGDVILRSVDGFLPSTLDGRRTGFECFHDDAAHKMDFFGRDHFPHSWKCALGLRWRGDFDELQAAWMAATAYAAAAGGVIFDHEATKIVTPEQGRKTVAEIVAARPRIGAVMAELMKKLTAGSA